MTFKFPAGVLAQHTAVLGKTGSGKTSTAKLMIEQVVPEGARVCILDPLKSDWWGLTSSADGKHAGLPFVILGGPHGHVPLHSSAGHAIGQVVADGSLPLSIIDMADFEAGGLQRFFVDFAETLYKKNRGVVYLVIEEAHEFAPKERSGIGAENMAIHWAKKLATGTRTKGIRLIVASQRTQALHNALIGSCDTMIAHRMTAPADQDPVLKWLKASAGKEAMKVVEEAFSNIKTGSGYLASGEAKLFEFVTFPRIHTFDNTKTPEGNEAQAEVKTATVDISQLKSVIGDAVKEAQANDPKELKKRIAELERQIRTTPAAAAADPGAFDRGQKAGFESGRSHGFQEGRADIVEQLEVYYGSLDDWRKGMPQPPVFKTSEPPPRAPALRDIPSTRELVRKQEFIPVKPLVKPARTNGYAHADISRPQQKILDQLAWLESMGVYPAPKETLAAVCRVSPSSSSYQNNLGALRTAELLEKGGDGSVSFTDSGRAAAAEVPETGQPIHEHWFEIVSRPQRAILEALFKYRAQPMVKDHLADEIGVSSSSSSFQNNLGALRALRAIDYPKPGLVELTRYVLP